MSVEQNIRLLDQTLREATDSTAGLAIAQLAPAYLDQTEVREILFSNLANRRLGAAVALVLGDSEDPEIRQRLSNIAEQATGLEQLRATLAIRALKTDREAER